MKKREPDFSVALVDRTRGNGHKLKDTKLHLNKRCVRETRHWKRYPREVVHSLPLEILNITTTHGSRQSDLADSA